MTRTSLRTRFVLVYHLLYTREGLPHFKCNIPSEPAPANILYKLKDLVNASAKLDHMTLYLELYLNLSCEYEDWPRIGHLIA